MRKKVMTVAFFAASMAVMAQGQDASIRHSDSKFPFKSDDLKQEWINENPSEYIKMGGDKSATPASVIPEFTSQAEKDAWIAQEKVNAILAKEAAATAASAASNNLPTLNANSIDPVSSAIPGVPVFATEADKEAWLAAQNPPAFEGANKEAMINAFNAGKPVFVDTGNPAADELNFNNAKQLYIQQNQAVYNYIISN
jgi:hypothetical protein